MARKNAEQADAFSATPGARGPGVHAVEEPLRVGTRDALIEDGHNDGDYVPDVESKGYHVGQVRQPVKLAVDERGQVVGFMSEHPSKFASAPTLADHKAAHNKLEASDEWNGDVEVSRGIEAPAPTGVLYDAPKSARGGSRKASAKSGDGETVGDAIREAGEQS